MVEGERGRAGAAEVAGAGTEAGLERERNQDRSRTGARQEPGLKQEQDRQLNLQEYKMDDYQGLVIFNECT